jgi:Phosphotransferase enzyme family
MDTEILRGGRNTAGVMRLGDTVRRPIERDPTFAHECLLHLQSVGFNGAPRFLGIDDLGREILTFIPGHVPSELGDYADAQLTSAAALLRRFHDATSTMPMVQKRGCAVACHNDWAPTNTVFADDEPIALIDFDTIRPGERLWDLGYSAFVWLDLGNDERSPDEQIRRLEVFAAGYDRADCSVTQIAVYALARQTALAASTRLRGKLDVAEWASQCAAWTALNVLEKLAPTGYSGLSRGDANVS